YVYVGSRVIQGWAIELVLIAMLLPFLAAAVDLFARCRRRHIPLAPALRSYRSRLAFWAWLALMFELFDLLGLWPGGTSLPPRWARAAVVVVGFAGPALIVGSFAFRYGLGWDAPWYLLQLRAIGYVPFVTLVLAIPWLAAAAQLTVLTAGRYAPYPERDERTI